jgi:hypothetical protein
MSIRALARRHGVHRRTVRQALTDATPPARKVPERSAPATGRYVDLVRRWLMEDQAAPREYMRHGETLGGDRLSLGTKTNGRAKRCRYRALSSEQQVRQAAGVA